MRGATCGLPLEKGSGMPNERGEKNQQCRCSHCEVITVRVQSIYDDCHETNIEQRSAIMFCWKAGETGTETYELLRKAYGEECV